MHVVEHAAFIDTLATMRFLGMDRAFVGKGDTFLGWGCDKGVHLCGFSFGVSFGYGVGS